MYLSDVFSFIKIKVTECSEQRDYNKKWIYKCAPQKEIDDELKKNGFFGINIYHNNYILNPD